MSEKAYDFQAIESKWFEQWDRAEAAGQSLYRAEENTQQAEILCARDAPLSLVELCTSGTYAIIRDRRRTRALYVDAWLQRAAPDGLGCVRTSR